MFNWFLLHTLTRTCRTELKCKKMWLTVANLLLNLLLTQSNKAQQEIEEKFHPAAANICGIIWTTSSSVETAFSVTQRNWTTYALISHPNLFSCSSSWSSGVLLNLNCTLCTLFVNAIWLCFQELWTHKLGTEKNATPLPRSKVYSNTHNTEHKLLKITLNALISIWTLCAKLQASSVSGSCCYYFLSATHQKCNFPKGNYQC